MRKIGVSISHTHPLRVPGEGHGGVNVDPSHYLERILSDSLGPGDVIAIIYVLRRGSHSCLPPHPPNPTTRIPGVNRSQ